MNLTQYYYIEGRLTAPANDVSDAHERLKKAGYVEEAAELLEAMKAFTTACRAVRNKVTERHQRERYSR